MDTLENFNGVSDVYEVPEDSEIVVDTVNQTVEESVQQILSYLEENKFI